VTRDRFMSTVLGRVRVHGDPAEAELVLWPGVLLRSEVHGALAEVLAGQGIRTCLVDPPGWSGARLEDGRFSMERCAEAMLQVLGAGPPKLVGGTSWGGAVAGWTALKAPDRVRGAVMMNPPWSRGSAAGLAAVVPPAATLLPRWLYGVVSTPAVLGPEADLRTRLRAWQLQVRSLQGVDRRDRYRAARQVFWQRASLGRAVAGLQVPVLVVAGRADPLCPLHHAEAASRTSPNMTLEVCERSGHLSAWECPGDTAGRIVRWAASLPAAGGATALSHEPRATRA
jgi:pimeloyl-ACP methyl ester carboxylesterase